MYIFIFLTRKEFRLPLRNDGHHVRHRKKPGRQDSSVLSIADAATVFQVRCPRGPYTSAGCLSGSTGRNRLPLQWTSHYNHGPVESQRVTSAKFLLSFHRSACWLSHPLL